MGKKKFALYLGYVIGIILFFIFLFKIFISIYFNEIYYKVPNITNYTLEEATDILKKNNLNINNVGEGFSSVTIGKVFLQTPAPDEIVKKGRNINVWISKGQALVNVPNLVGKNYLEAKTIAENKGLIIDKTIYVEGQGEYNSIIATEPETNTLLTQGEKISFIVSKSSKNKMITMPDIVGLPLEEALSIINKSNLVIGEVNFITVEQLQKNIVVSSSIKSKSQVESGSVVNIYVSK